MADTRVSPLRQRMIDDMTMRNFAPRTQEGYIRAVKGFAAVHRFRFTPALARRSDGPETARRMQVSVALEATERHSLDHAPA